MQTYFYCLTSPPAPLHPSSLSPPSSILSFLFVYSFLHSFICSSEHWLVFMRSIHLIIQQIGTEASFQVRLGAGNGKWSWTPGVGSLLAS